MYGILKFLLYCFSDVFIYEKGYYGKIQRRERRQQCFLPYFRRCLRSRHRKHQPDQYRQIFCCPQVRRETADFLLLPIMYMSPFCPISIRWSTFPPKQYFPCYEFQTSMRRYSNFSTSPAPTQGGHKNAAGSAPLPAQQNRLYQRYDFQTFAWSLYHGKPHSCAFQWRFDELNKMIRLRPYTSHGKLLHHKTVERPISGSFPDRRSKRKSGIWRQNFCGETSQGSIDQFNTRKHVLGLRAIFKGHIYMFRTNLLNRYIHWCSVAQIQTVTEGIASPRYNAQLLFESNLVPKTSRCHLVALHDGITQPYCDLGERIAASSETRSFSLPIYSLPTACQQFHPRA